VATSTLANSPNPHEFSPKPARPFALPSYPKAQPRFRVFPNGDSEYHWRIVAFSQQPNDVSPQKPELCAQEMHPPERAAQQRSQK
jgi:hypothetical protein